MDLYLFNTIINTIWYIFTILFLLYRFTSFFTYVYGFVQFCAKAFSWLSWAWDQIHLFFRRRQGYFTLDEEQNYLLPQQHRETKTYFQIFKEKCANWLSRVFGKKKSTRGTGLQTFGDVPLYETQRESFFIREPPLNDSYYTRLKDEEAQHFEDHMRDLQDSSYRSVSLYPPDSFIFGPSDKVFESTTEIDTKNKRFPDFSSSTLFQSDFIEQHINLQNSQPNKDILRKKKKSPTNLAPIITQNYMGLGQDSDHEDNEASSN